jgi:protein TonB
MRQKRLLLFILLVSVITSIIAQTAPNTVTFKVRKPKVLPPEEMVIEEKISDEPAFVIVEESASFQGGDLNKFRLWVQKNIIYPRSAAEAGISGRVFVQFAVNSKGQVVDVKILRGVDPELDKETVRAVMSSPQWVAGRQGGKPIKQQFTIPILFEMQ